MPDVVTWKSAEEIMRMITVYNAVIKGMNMAQAAETLGFTLMESGLYVKTVAEVTTGVSSGLTAGEAIAGASLSGGATTSVANLTLYTTASGETAVGALGSVALPIASVCLVGAAGYALGDVIGDTIDKTFPDFFQGLFGSISTFVTGDKYGLAFIFDASGRVYMPKPAQEAIAEFITSTGESDSFEFNDETVPYKELSVGDVTGVVTTSGVPYGVSVDKIISITSTSPVYGTMYRVEIPNPYNPSIVKKTLEPRLWSKEAFTIEVERYRYNDSLGKWVSSNSKSTKKGTQATVNGKNIYEYTSSGSDVPDSNLGFCNMPIWYPKQQ